MRIKKRRRIIYIFLCVYRFCGITDKHNKKFQMYSVYYIISISYYAVGVDHMMLCIIYNNYLIFYIIKDYRHVRSPLIHNNLI